ncbi:MAG: hypothetical protein WBC88_06005 [Candidatus Zixiibacteriota bacterium]
MSRDTSFPTSYDRKPLGYTSVLEEVQTVLNSQLSSKMLASARDYEDCSRAADEVAKQVFPGTVPALAQTIATKYYVTELRSSEGRVIFKEGFPLDIELSKDDDLFFFQNSRFNLFGSGGTKEDALKDFAEFFIHDYISYKNTPPDKLSRDARQLLQEYNSVIGKLEIA